MYKSSYDKTEREEVNFVKRNIIWFIMLIFIISGISYFFTRGAQVVETGIISYEQFQEMYNTCQKINSDLGIIKKIPDTDKMFSEFSKEAMLAAKRQQLTRWVEEYNAKSRMINKSIWKSNALPHDLNVNQFENF